MRYLLITSVVFTYLTGCELADTRDITFSKYSSVPAGQIKHTLIYRFENDEVIYYGRREIGLQCKWKDKRE